MPKVQFTAEVEPELLQQIERAAESDDTSVDQWVQDAIVHRLQHASDAVLEDGDDDGDDAWPSDFQRGVRSAKRLGSENPPRLRGGKTISEIVIEDRG